MDAQRDAPPTASCYMHSESSIAGTEEDWDEIEAKTTSGVEEALARAKQSKVLLTIQHGTPSEKKWRRKQEEERHRNLRNAPDN
jgi:hypothetical protein